MISSLRNSFGQALHNLKGDLFSNLTTICIFAIPMLIFLTFSLITFNLTSFFRSWEEKIEVIAYLNKNIPIDEVEALLNNTRLLHGIEAVRYVSPSDAMNFMESKLGRQKNLLAGIQSTVLPPSFEIRLKKEFRNSLRINEVISQLNQFPQFEEIQYGQAWVEKFSFLVHLFRLSQWILGGLLLVAMLFIISNTLQLTAVSRSTFTRAPFYIEGTIQGLLGAGIAILLLLLLYKALYFYLTPYMRAWGAGIPILFLPPDSILWSILGGMVLGFFGSFMASLRLQKHRK